MEEGESPTEAGARELLEETGYGDATRLTLIAGLSPNTSTHANRVHTVLTEGVLLIGVQANDGVEVLDVERVPYWQALDLALSGAIMQTSHIAPKPAKPEPKRLRYYTGGRSRLARGRCRRGLLNATMSGSQGFFLVTTGSSSPARFLGSATPGA